MSSVAITSRRSWLGSFGVGGGRGLVTLAAALLGTYASAAAVLDVPSQAYPTIQSAINAAQNGDTVQVAAGTYNERLTWATKSISLIGAGAAVTIVDAQKLGRCLNVTNVPDTARIEGFTFTGGSANSGAGLYLSNSSPTVANNIITGNSATSYDGGGISASAFSGTLRGNTIAGNSATRTGGGIYVTGSSSVSSSFTLEGNNILDNSASGSGGAYFQYSTVTLTDNTFSRNMGTGTTWASPGGLMLSNSTATLTGNTVTGNSTAVDGGGMYIYISKAELINNTIGLPGVDGDQKPLGNHADRNGGGLYVGPYSEVKMDGNKILSNSATSSGGGLAAMGGTSLTITSNLFLGNDAGSVGGGILLKVAGVLVNNVIARNTAAHGGGARSENVSPTLTNNTIVLNTGGGYERYPSGSATVTNCILWGNTGDPDLSGVGATYSDVGTGNTAGTGNISADPLFVDAADNDYHLTAQSPCVDAGSNAAPALPATDKDGNPRIQSSAPDMGAYESPEGGNRPPVATDDGYATDEDTALSVPAPGVLANDSDPDPGDVLTVVAFDTTSALGATVVVNTDGSFTYDPTSSAALNGLAPGETAADSFTYTIGDGNGGTGTATVTITVAGVNVPPVANDDAYETDEDTVLVVPAPGVLDNDYDADGHTPSATAGATLNYDADGETDLLWQSSPDVSLNRWDFTGSGVTLDTGVSSLPGITQAYTFTGAGGASNRGLDDLPGDPSNDSASWEFWLKPSPGSDVDRIFETGGGGDGMSIVYDGASNRIVFTVDDGGVQRQVSGGSTLLNTSEFHQVVAVYHKDFNGTQDVIRLYIDGVLVDDSDPSTTVGPEDGADVATSELDDWDGGDTSTLAVIGTGLAQTTPSNSNYEGQIAKFKFYESALTAEQVTANYMAIAGQLVVIEVDGDPASVGVSVGLASGATLVCRPDGSFTYDPNGQFGHLAAGEAATDTFTYTIRDSEGGSAAATVTVTVHGVNDPPVANDDTGATDEDTPLSVSAPGVLANDSDPEASDTLGVVAFDAASALGATVAVNVDGSYGYDPTTSSTLNALAVGETAADSFTYTIGDGDGGTATATVTITVAGVNDPPVASDDAGETDEDTLLSVSAPGVLANDSDPDANDILGVVAFDATTALGAAVVVKADGSYTCDPTTSSALKALAVAETATDTFTYTISDGQGGSAAATVTVTVHGVNDPPVADAGPDQALEQVGSEETVEVTLDGSGSSDPDTGDVLTYAWTWDGGSATGVNPTVSLPVRATIVTLVVNDGQVDSEPDTVEIAVTRHIFYVDDDATNDPGPTDNTVSDPDEDGSPQHPFDRVQEAIAAAASGDTIVVLAGTYPEHLTWSAKSLQLLGAGAATTIVDAGGTGRCLLMQGVPDTARIEGFTFTGGNAAGGGGLRLEGSSATLTGNAISGNTGYHGGGLYITGGAPTLDSNTIENNTAANTPYASFGGGVHATSSSPTLTWNIIRGNSSPSYGGGLYFNACSVAANNNRVESNSSADTGGGIYCNGTSGELTDNFVKSNTASRYGGGIYLLTSSLELTENVISDNLVDSTTGYHGGGGVAVTGDTASRLTDNTISGNWAPSGGGLHLSGSSPVMIGNDIEGNKALAGAGGGMFLNSSPASVTGGTISSNTASQVGGGLAMDSSSPTLTGVTISGNNAAFQGGGLRAWNSFPTLKANQITGNTTTNGPGGGLSFISSSPTVTDANEISGNTAPAGGGVYFYRSGGTLSGNVVASNAQLGVFCWGSSPQISGNTITGNTGDGICLQVYYGGGGNPAQASLDVLSQPAITGNTIADNTEWGIVGEDTAASNKATLEADNALGANGSGQVLQWWRGLVQVVGSGGSPVAGASVSVLDNDGDTAPDYGSPFTSSASGYAPGTANPSDSRTWPAIAEFEVDNGGARAALTPQTLRASLGAAWGEATHSWDGRYQIAQVQLNALPVVTASGASATYVENSPAVTVDPGITVVDPDGPDLTGATVAISANFRASEDSLAYTPVAGISGSYNSATGVLTLKGDASAASYQEAFRAVQFHNSSEDPSAQPRTVTFAIGGDASYFAGTAHWYRFVSTSLTWPDARAAAQASSFYGLQGYLTTVTSASEDAFIASLLPANEWPWMGASDLAVEGIWRWVTGPEGLEDGGQGRHFFSQPPGTVVPGEYANWEGAGPNDYPPGEDYAHFYPNGTWNDGLNTLSLPCLVEYGGMPGDPDIQLAADVTVNVQPVNDPPTVEVDNPGVTADEGQTAQNTGTFADVDQGDGVTVTASIGVISQVGTQSGTWAWSLGTTDGPESQIVTITATDGDGAEATVSFELVVDNVAPAATVESNAVTVDEGNTALNTGTFSDAGADDVYLSASVGTVVDNGDGIWGWSFATTDGPEESQTVTITVTDSDGAASTVSFALVVNDVPPDVAPGNAVVTVDEGATALNTGTVSDAGDDTVILSASVGTVTDNGDGTWSWFLDTTDGPDQSQAVTIAATDSDGAVTTTTFELVVNNVAPVIQGIVAPLDPVEARTAISVAATFTDAGVQDTHTAIWEWGDTTTSSVSVTQGSGEGAVSGTHDYETAGVYTIKLTVTDDDGGSATAVYQYVVVYDPSEGFVTGGGWIQSPEGAYAPDPSLTGKASFGFVAKYKKGASVPTGQTEFQYRVASLNFHSTDYQWLVVAGAKAQFKGSGKINNAGDYGFLLTGIDGALPGGGGVDKFRIKIWDKATGQTVYDNKIGTDDYGDEATALGGGSIVIHKD